MKISLDIASIVALFLFLKKLDHEKRETEEMGNKKKKI